MRAWIVATYEPLPGIDTGSRLLRCGQLANHLVSAGHEVHWFTSTFNHVRRANRREATTEVDVAANYRITMLYAPEYAQSVSLARVRHNRVMAAAFREAVRERIERPDVILACVPSLELAEEAVAYAQENRVPVVVDVRDPWPEVYLSPVPPPLRGLARVALRGEFARARRIFAGAAALIAVSNDYLRWARALSNRPPNVRDAVFPIGYPVTTPDDAALADGRRILRDHVRLDPDQLIVAFAGMFGASYDLETVVDAARRLSQEPGHRIHIVVAGDGDKRAALQQRATGVSTISFTGWLDASAVDALLRASHVGLAAYASRARQSLPNKPFEYMAAGLAIVSSLPGELEQLLAQHRIGRQYRPHDASALAEQLLWLWRHPDERAAMGERARKLLVAEFRADEIYAGMASFLSELAECPARIQAREEVSR